MTVLNCRLTTFGKPVIVRNIFIFLRLVVEGVGYFYPSSQKMKRLSCCVLKFSVFPYSNPFQTASTLKELIQTKRLSQAGKKPSESFLLTGEFGVGRLCERKEFTRWWTDCIENIEYLSYEQSLCGQFTPYKLSVKSLYGKCGNISRARQDWDDENSDSSLSDDSNEYSYLDLNPWRRRTLFHII